MTDSDFFKARLYFTIIVTIAIWLLLIWDYYHDGVPTHHLLQQEDLPGFSNWLGGILIPLLTWFLLHRIHKRISNNTTVVKFPSTIVYTFLGALTFGILLSVFFTLQYSDLPFYMIVSLVLLALFYPIYRAECFLGFVIGMLFTFGGVLPIIIITILSLIGVFLYRIVRPGMLFIASKISYLITSKKSS
jgi:MFS family permease